jgi:hypothetical protein
LISGLAGRRLLASCREATLSINDQLGMKYANAVEVWSTVLVDQKQT